MSAVSSLFRKHLYSLRNVKREAEKQSSFKVAFIAAFVIVFEGVLFLIFNEGLEFLHRLGGVGIMLIYRLFAITFLGLSIMLIISSVITTYATMYRSGEIPFLLVSPFSTAQVVLYKFFEACTLSSWAFFFIIVPFVVAFAIQAHLSPLFALWTFLFSLPLVVLCSAIGSVITMVYIRWAPAGRFLKIIGIVLAIVAVGAIWYAAREAKQAEDPNGLVLTRLIPGLKLAEYRLLPSWWMTEGIISLTRNQWGRGFMLLLMTTLNMFAVVMIVEAAGKRVFYQGWQRVTSASSITNRCKPLMPWLDRALRFLPDDARAMIVKDTRMFLRDPLQWSQVLIFLGLLGLYFASLRSFRYHELPDNWRMFIAFLNIFSMSTVLCSLASRFSYPQISLEGQGFWILGLAPTTMKRVLLTKFSLALVCTLAVSVPLMYLSTGMLNVDIALKRVAIALSVAVSLGITGMSTGLGAAFLDLKQRNPAAIVSGFGGTLNLVLSLGFMIAVLFPFAAVFYLQLLDRIGEGTVRHAMQLLYVWLVVATAAATAIPMLAGWRNLMRREY